jgi:Na+/H+ antiporter NhaC
VAPVVVVVVVTIGGLYISGLQSLRGQGISSASLREVIDASDPFTVLLWASLMGVSTAVLMAVAQGILGLGAALEAVLGGFKSLLPAIIVLILAWSLGEVCNSLSTADFLIAAVGPALPSWMIPAVVFIVAASVAFATGTSWGTMAILTPLAVPLVVHAGGSTPHLVAATVSAILGGSVFGDHCSPISDTTIMSSMASSCDHVDHVRTQLPYALFGAAIALVVGYIPGAMLEIPAGFLLIAGAGTVAVWMWAVARPVDRAERGVTR